MGKKVSIKFPMKEKSISLCELLARLTEVWNEVSTRVSVKLLNSRPCGVLCSYDHWGVGTCFLCLLIKTPTHSLVIGVDSFATFASNDRAGWQIGGGMECYTSTLFPALVSSFTQAEPKMCTHISSFRASMAFKLQHLWRHHGKSNLNKHFISIEAAAGGGCGVCRERKAFVLSVVKFTLPLPQFWHSEAALRLTNCQNTGWVAGFRSAARLTDGVGNDTAPLKLTRCRVIFKSSISDNYLEAEFYFCFEESTLQKWLDFFGWQHIWNLPTVRLGVFWSKLRVTLQRKTPCLRN